MLITYKHVSIYFVFSFIRQQEKRHNRHCPVVALISYGRENALRFLLLVQLGEHGLLLIRCQLADADSCVSPDGGEDHAGPAEGCPRHVGKRGYAQCGRHIGTSSGPR